MILADIQLKKQYIFSLNKYVRIYKETKEVQMVMHYTLYNSLNVHPSIHPSAYPTLGHRGEIQGRNSDIFLFCNNPRLPKGDLKVFSSLRR